MNISQYTKDISNGAYDDTLQELYGTEAAVLAAQKQRYLNALDSFAKLYPGKEDVEIFSAPGRTEVGGNHTDHQNGCVLAAAVNLDAVAVVAFNEDNIINLDSEGHSKECIKLDDLSVHEDEKGTTAGIIRGVASKFSEMGVKIGGFDAYVTSDVLSGSGLSSSAAFEVLLGTIIDKHYNGGKAGAIEIAKIGQYAENVYFGKKSGLMDQMVSSVGGFVFIDFADPDKPKIKKIFCNLTDAGYALCITDTKGSHADLIDDYSSIRTEMESIAAKFGKKHLSEVEENKFIAAVPELRKTCSDRAILRAAHFFGDNKNAADEAKALWQNDLEKFLTLVRQSGLSSAMWLQNLYSCSSPSEQGIPLGLWASGQVLGDEGAARVHGGGFAGTIQAFVPFRLGKKYREKMDSLFGENSCKMLKIRQSGGIQL